MNCTLLTDLLLARRGRCATLGRPGTISAALLDRAERRAVAAREHQRRDQRRLAVLRLEQSRAKLGRWSVPASFFCCQTGDSGRNGRMMISGIAGSTPDISV